MKLHMQVIIMSVVCIFLSAHIRAQGTITGPTCVKSGFEYQYQINVKGRFKNKSQVCVTGGNLVGSKTECTSIDTFALIKVIWSEKSKQGSIGFSSEKGNSDISVNIIEELNPGSINTRKSQTIDYNASREQIVCSAASGGSCNPVYEYQWESSEDAVEWKEIKGETGVSLANQAQQKRPMFYRRRVTEKTSGLIAYSDIASVYLNSISF